FIQAINRRVREIRHAPEDQDTGSAQILQGLAVIDSITKQVGSYTGTIKQEAGMYLENAKELPESIRLMERQIHDISGEIEQVSRSFQTSMKQHTGVLESMNQALKKLKMRA
ncbi:MAG: hypothetical protein LBU25_06735, partial [Treponema sp.]|nr:hypothetical protein [Treponema sp.]